MSSWSSPVELSKCSSLVQPFHIKEGNDLEEFWSKILVLTAAKGWADEDIRMMHLPLHLESDAISGVLMHVRPCSDKKIRKSELVLVSAFSVTPLRVHFL